MKTDNIKQIVIEVDDKEYTLEYNRESIKKMEASGFSFAEAQTKIITAMDVMIEGALYKNHKYLKKAEIERVIESIYEEQDVSALMEALFEMLADAVPNFNEEDSVPKKGFKIVR